VHFHRPNLGISTANFWRRRRKACGLRDLKLADLLSLNLLIPQLAYRTATEQVRNQSGSVVNDHFSISQSCIYIYIYIHIYTHIYIGLYLRRLQSALKWLGFLFHSLFGVRCPTHRQGLTPASPKRFDYTDTWHHMACKECCLPLVSSNMAGKSFRSGVLMGEWSF
jgi:hypothetical protein